MNSRSRPAVVVIAFNRPGPLHRLLRSLAAADHGGLRDVPLIVSIDRSEDDGVERVARDFVWPHGEKVLRMQETRLGLRAHVLACGDLSLEHEAVIVLEDDLYVAPCYYAYAVEALGHYAADERIAGISLYGMRVNEGARRPFEAVDDGRDGYFLQLPSSWGQAWTAAQWGAFRAWYDARSWHEGWDGVPAHIQQWPESSWKKYFACYLVQRDRYFVYPRRSLSTNFGDQGTHFGDAVDFLQVPLLVDYLPPRWGALDKAVAIYDAYMEILPSALARMNPRFRELAVAVDLYGTKPASMLARQALLLTCRHAPAAIERFSGRMRPHELGVLLGQAGRETSLVQASELPRLGSPPRRGPVHGYDTPMMSLSDALSLTRSSIRDAIARRLKRKRTKRRS